MDILKRQYYSNRIKSFAGKGIIKVITGQRRVGKSCILLQLMGEIKIDHPDSNIIYINKEQEEFRFITGEDELFAYLKDKIVPGKENYLFIDEIQDIIGFEHVLRSLQSTESCDIFCSGSNAKMLSGELSTYLSGRYIEFRIHSLSYTEFLCFNSLPDEDNSLKMFLTFGGLPYLSRLSLNEEMVSEYLKNLYSTILLKDVVSREGIRNVDLLERLVEYLSDNVGSIFSATNIHKFLKSQRINISTSVIISYLNALSNAYIINKTRRLDVQGLKKFEIGEKYYFEDLGLRNCLQRLDFGRDIHKLMENSVYQHLRILEYDVYVGKLNNMEIDFVGVKGGNSVYVQVTYLIMDEKTHEREFGNLMKIENNYPKYVVSMDSFNSSSNYKGIHHLHLREFLKLEKL